jgi:hypothetical protein
LTVKHSTLKNERISYFFETFVNSELRYETFVDFHRNEWYTYPAGPDSTVLLHGQFAACTSDGSVLERIKLDVMCAIESGRI